VKGILKRAIGAFLLTGLLRRLAMTKDGVVAPLFVIASVAWRSSNPTQVLVIHFVHNPPLCPAKGIKKTPPLPAVFSECS